VLNWEKCHFMVQEGVVLSHIVSNRGIEVDKAKIEVIERLPHSHWLKGRGVSLVMWDFIATLSRTSPILLSFLPNFWPRMPIMCLLMIEFHKAFYRIKHALIFAPIIQPPDWSLPLRSCAMLVIMWWGQFWGK